MGAIKPQTKQDKKYFLEKHEFYTAMHFAYTYQTLKEELASIGGVSGLSYEHADMPRSPSTTGDPTSRDGMRRAEISSRIALIESTAREAGEDLAEWILKAVTCEGVTYPMLYTMHNIPCSRGTFYDRRRKFYFLLWSKLQERIGHGV